ncbi:MAG: exodeoxyribonuclease III [Bacteroidetes bacterium]|nr:exodeoxyribonuclease III [Bacteroidota bacterium]
MKILSYNVNGIRAAMGKGLIDYLKEENADVVCFQELKAMAEQFDVSEFEALGYHCHWFSAQKKGYSGVGLLSKQKPKHVEYGCGHELYDFEGRFLRADFDDVSVISAYFPSGTSGDERQDIKYEFLDFTANYIQELRKNHPNLVLCGDYNIANNDIDIHSPKTNQKSSGFLPEERAWLTKFFENGMVDSFRYLHPEEQKYSWWSFRFNARKNNKGWRIDYNAISEPLLPRLKAASIENNAVHSDHCPIVVELS